MTEIALTAFATFFVAVMPFKAAPFFAGLADGWPDAQRRRAALKAVLVATVVLLVLGIGGDEVRRLFGIAVFPMAMPVIAGPATVTAVLVLVSAHPDTLRAQTVVLTMLLLVLAITLVLLLMASPLERAIGATSLGVMSRVAGILLAALAAEMPLQGIGESGAFHSKGP